MSRSLSFLLVCAASALVFMAMMRTQSNLALPVRTSTPSRTRACAADKSLPVPWMAGAPKPRSPKPAYTKGVKTAPLRKQMSWTGEWVDPVAMLSAKPDFSRAGKPKTASTYTSNKVATPVRKMEKKSWTGNLVPFYQKLIAKGQPYVAPSMEKPASTNTLRMKNSWIGSASDSLIRGTAEAINYVENPQPKQKMWMTVGDPKAPWKSENTKAIAASSAAAAPVKEVIGDQVENASEAAAKTAEVKEAVTA